MQNKFQVGKWYTFEDKEGAKYISRLKSISNDWLTFDNSSYGHHEIGGATFIKGQIGESLTPATHEQIKAHLIALAQKKGFEVGKTALMKTGINKYCFIGEPISGMKYFPDIDYIDSTNDVGFIYKAGQWAEIKEQPLVPEYVKMVANVGLSGGEMTYGKFVGKIYRTKDEIAWAYSGSFTWHKIMNSLTYSKNFEPSTKEAWLAQHKPFVPFTFINFKLSPDVEKFHELMETVNSMINLSVPEEIMPGDYVRVIDGGIGARGANGQLGMVTTKMVEFSKYGGVIPENMKICIKTPEGFWGLAKYHKVVVISKEEYDRNGAPEYVEVVTAGGNNTGHPQCKNVINTGILKVLRRDNSVGLSDTMEVYVCDGDYVVYKSYTRPSTKEQYDAFQKMNSAPKITINGYKGEFFEDYVQFGEEKMDKELFIELAGADEESGLFYSEKDGRGEGNCGVERIQIGKRLFTVAQIKEIAEYYKSLDDQEKDNELGLQNKNIGFKPFMLDYTFMLGRTTGRSLNYPFPFDHSI